MLSLTGLLPIQGAVMPSYPLWTANLLIFATMTILNLLFLARKTWVRLLVGFILTGYTSFVALKRAHNLEQPLIFSEMNFDKPSLVLVCQSLSPYYEVYYLLLLSVAFVIFGVASHNMEESKNK